ncbi:MAG: hypothetical protein ACC628_19505 [Pirellulaceae bacterium]
MTQKSGYFGSLGEVNMNSSDTQIATMDSDTVALGITFGLAVRIGGGELEGLSGTLIAQRSSGRLLVRLEHGVYVEIDRYLLEAG